MIITLLLRTCDSRNPKLGIQMLVINIIATILHVELKLNI